MKETSTPDAEYEKPRRYRDRSKRRREDTKETIHPVRKPYERANVNWKHVVVDGLGEDYEDT